MGIRDRLAVSRSDDAGWPTALVQSEVSGHSILIDRQRRGVGRLVSVGFDTDKANAIPFKRDLQLVFAIEEGESPPLVPENTIHLVRRGAGDHTKLRDRQAGVIIHHGAVNTWYGQECDDLLPAGRC